MIGGASFSLPARLDLGDLGAGAVPQHHGDALGWDGDRRAASYSREPARAVAQDQQGGGDPPRGDI